MFTENGITIDLGQAKEAVSRADVFAVGFPLFPQRLIVDTRHDTSTPPLVQVVEPVASVEERFFWLGQHRPGLGTPERFFFFVWPHSIAFMRDSSLAQAVVDRIAASGYHEAVSMCEAAFDDLAGRERQAGVAAIRGENCLTLWPRNT